MILKWFNEYYLIEDITPKGMDGRRTRTYYIKGVLALGTQGYNYRLTVSEMIQFKLAEEAVQLLYGKPNV